MTVLDAISLSVAVLAPTTGVVCLTIIIFRQGQVLKTKPRSAWH